MNKQIQKEMEMMESCDTSVYVKRLKEKIPKEWEFYLSEMYDSDTDYQNSMINLSPEDDSNYRSRGEAFVELERYKEAINDFNQAILLCEDDPKYHEIRAAAYEKIRGYKQAVKDYTIAINIDNESVCYMKRSNAYFNMFNYEKAKSDFEKAIYLDDSIPKEKFLINTGINPLKYDITKDEVNAYNSANEAYCYFLLGKYNKAFTCINKAITLNAEIADFFALRSAIYLNTTKYDKALSDINKAILMDDENADYYNLRGLINNRDRSKENNSKNEETDFLKAIEINSNVIEYYMNLGIHYFVCKKYTEATNIFSQAIEKFPDNFEIYYYRAKSYISQRMYKLAIKDISYIVDNNKNDQYAILERGDCYELSGDYLSALKDYDYALYDQYSYGWLNYSFKRIHKSIKSNIEVKESTAYYLYSHSIYINHGEYELANKSLKALSNLLENSVNTLREEIKSISNENSKSDLHSAKSNGTKKTIEDRYEVLISSSNELKDAIDLLRKKAEKEYLIEQEVTETGLIPKLSKFFSPDRFDFDINKSIYSMLHNNETEINMKNNKLQLDKIVDYYNTFSECLEKENKNLLDEVFEKYRIGDLSPEDKETIRNRFYFDPTNMEKIKIDKNATFYAENSVISKLWDRVLNETEKHGGNIEDCRFDVEIGDNYIKYTVKQPNKFNFNKFINDKKTILKYKELMRYYGYIYVYSGNQKFEVINNKFDTAKNLKGTMIELFFKKLPEIKKIGKQR